MARKERTVRPVLQGLEDRQLLSDGIAPQYLARIPIQQANIANGWTASQRRYSFTTVDGAHVVITLYGTGTLDVSKGANGGTYYDPTTNALTIVFEGTNSSSSITGAVHGGSGHVRLKSMLNAAVSPNSTSGVGTSQLKMVNLRQFDLIDGGRINLAAGVGDLFLHSIGANTQITVASLPLSSSQVNPSPSSPTLTLNYVDTGNGIQLAGVGGLQIPGATAGTSSSSSSSGFITRIDANGQISLIPVSTTTTTTTKPPGVNIVVQSVNGKPRSVPLANPQIYGYDPATAQLIRFDARTGAELGTIQTSLTPDPNAIGEVGLGRNNGVLDVLVAVGTTVQAYDVSTGAFVGQFTTTNILNGAAIDGVAQADHGTLVLTSSAANQGNPTFTSGGSTGAAQIVDVTASLAAGIAVPPTVHGSPVGPMSPSREFYLTGGATGAAGINSVLVGGKAYFDTSTPNLLSYGVLTANSANDTVSESARTKLSAANSTAIGSVDLFPAIDVFNSTSSTNTMTLYNPSGFTTISSVTLQYPNKLTGLSESFHSELAGGAVINAYGIVNQFTAQKVTGLTMSTIGYDTLVQVRDIADSAFVSLPMGHVSFGHRTNTQVFSSSPRTFSTRGGVTTISGLRPVGPLTLTGAPYVP